MRPIWNYMFINDTDRKLYVFIINAWFVTTFPAR